jgi:hypothetical protein
MEIIEIGKQFFRLRVVGPAPNDSKGRPMWHCRCECGNFKMVLSRNLRNHSTKSCGCLQQEVFSMRKRLAGWH